MDPQIDPPHAVSFSLSGVIYRQRDFSRPKVFMVNIKTRPNRNIDFWKRVTKNQFLAF